jgi:uncharacterized paraquat-inducible protein A
MDRWARHAPVSVSRLHGLGALPRLRVLFCLFTLAIQLAIPVAHIWHIAADHTPTVALCGQRQDDRPEAFCIQVEPHRDHEVDNSRACPVCHAIVYMQDSIDIQAQVAADIEQSICHLPLAGSLATQTLLYTSAPRAPPVFS